MERLGLRVGHAVGVDDVLLDEPQRGAVALGAVGVVLGGESVDERVGPAPAALEELAVDPGLPQRGI